MSPDQGYGLSRGRLAARFWAYGAGGRLSGVCDKVGSACTSTTTGRHSVPTDDAAGRVTRVRWRLG